MRTVDNEAERLATRATSQLLRRAARVARSWWVVLAVDTAAGVGLGLARPALLATAIDAAVRGAHGSARAVIALAVLSAASLAVGVTGQLVEATGVARTDVWLRRRVTRQMLDLGLAGQRAFPPGDLVSRINVAAPQAAGLVPKLVDTVAGLTISLGALLALWLIDWRIVAIVALATPFVIVIVRVLSREMSLSTISYQQAQGDLATRFVEALRGARSIRACDTVEQEIERVTVPLPRIEAAGRAIWRTLATSAGRAGLIVPLVTLGALAAAGQGLAAGRLTPGELIATTGYVPIALGLFDHISGLGSIAVDRASARRLAEVVAEQPPRRGKTRLGDGKGRLELRGVTVGRAGHVVLDRLDLDVPAGCTLAVVGRSGAGKTTLAHVAGGLLAPDAGEVLLDGVPIGDLDPADLRDVVAYAFDSPHLVGSTIGDAVGYGMAAPRRSEVHRALELAKASAFVARLPGGIDAPLATAPFSGGERQRLGLARALVRRPRVLILDDATSSLDTVTEAQVQAAIGDAGGEGTVVMVAHRVGTAARADLVAWIESGRVRRLATHAQLWRDPSYRALFHDGQRPWAAPTPVAVPARPPEFAAPAERPAPTELTARPVLALAERPEFAERPARPEPAARPEFAERPALAESAALAELAQLAAS
jgi:ATP-binding cassette subfamily B protein